MKKILARKRFGQHFLSDLNTLEKMARAINPLPTDHIIEIGPGHGALTNYLLQPERLSLLEIDRDLIQVLKENFKQQHIDIIETDATRFDFSSIIEEKARVVGNLPYNVSTPLLFKVIESIDKIIDMHFLLQKEVVDRMVAQPGDSNFSRLSVMLQYHCKVKRLFNVSRHVFTPPPKVESAFVKLIPIEPAPVNYQNFSQLVREAFNQRRKTISNSLKSWYTSEAIRAIGLDPQARPQALSVQDFILLANNVKKT